MVAHSKAIVNTIAIEDFIRNEIPSGIINSINKVFSLINNPVVGTVELYLNGMLQYPGVGFDYTISGNIITFNKAPRSNSEVLVHYIKQ